MSSISRGVAEIPLKYLQVVRIYIIILIIIVMYILQIHFQKCIALFCHVVHNLPAAERNRDLSVNQENMHLCLSAGNSDTRTLLKFIS